MHTITIAERDGEYQFVCSCGASGFWYGTRGVAQEAGSVHKEHADGDPDRDKTNRTQTPHLGY